MAYAAVSKTDPNRKRRNLLVREVDDIIETLKNDTSPLAYVFEHNEQEILGFVQNIKELNREFRIVISEKGLLDHDEFKEDQKGINEIYQNIYKELAICREKVTKVELQAVGGEQMLGQVLGEAIDKLSTTLSESVKEINTDRINPKIKRPYFDGTG